MEKKNQLPTLSELYSDVGTVKKTDEFNYLMNEHPPEKWVIKHPFIQNYRYLPIDKVEYLLRKIFKNYRIEVIGYKTILNAVSCHVRVHYKHPVTGEWMYHDGVGAQEIQTTKNSGSLKMDMSNVNRGAVMMALPIAKTIAVKDACDHFGRLFGADLNRTDLIKNNVDSNLQDLDLEKIKKQIS